MAELNSKHVAARHIFLLWKHLARQKIEKKKCHALASKIYQLSTCHETWQRWSQHLRTKRKLKHMGKLATAIHLLTALKQNFQTWRKQCEQVKTCRTKCKQLEELHRGYLLRLYFSEWKHHSQDFHLAACRAAQLGRIGRSLLCRRVLGGWRAALGERNRQQWLLTRALALRITETFNAWYRELNLSKYKRKRISEFMQIRNFSLCKACFEGWKKYLIIQFQENSKIRRLTTLRGRMELRRLFLLWGRWGRARHLQRRALGERREGVCRIYLRQLFEIWSEKTRSVTELKRKIHLIRKVFNNVLLRKYLDQWTEYSKLMLLRQETFKKIKAYVNKLEVKIYFSSWREQLEVKERNRQMTVLAMVHWSLTLTRKSFMAWKQHSQHRTLRKQRYLEAIELHNSFVLKQGLRVILMKGAGELVKKTERAMEHSQQKETILCNYFSRWINYVRFDAEFDQKTIPKLTFVTAEGKPGENARMSKLPGSKLQRSERFMSVTRIEPKIPEFLYMDKYSM